MNNYSISISNLLTNKKLGFENADTHTHEECVLETKALLKKSNSKHPIAMLFLMSC